MLKKFLREHIVLRKTMREKNLELVNYSVPDSRRKIFNQVQSLTDGGLLMSNSEAYQLFSLVESTKKVEGDMAEVGVYKGQSARLLLEASECKKHLHLFDTFAGLPEPTEEDTVVHKLSAGEYYASLSEVQEFLDPYRKRVSYHEGIFPDTADAVSEKRFSFVNVDVDLHNGTLAALEFFYPRMNPGGIIISHDYVKPGGVRDAITSFFSDKPEPIIEVGAGTQGFIVKCA